jgi:transcriptional regulator with XRE-family HTH domain
MIKSKHTKNTLGAYMRLAREKHRISGVQMAEDLKISAAQYRRYERDEVDPPVRVIRNMAKILNVSTETLINGTSDDNQDVQSNLTIDVSAGETIQIAVRGRSGEEENYKMKRYKDGISSQKTVKDKKPKSA